MSTKPPVIHDEPELIITSASPAEKKKEKKEEDAVVLRSGHITLTQEGDVVGPAGGLPSSGSAGSSAGGLPPGESSAMVFATNGSASMEEGSAAEVKSDGRMKPYDIDARACTTAASLSLEKLGICLLYTSPSPRD